MSTRRTLLVAGAALLAGPAFARAPLAVLPRPDSLQRQVAAATASGKALVVLVSLEGCPWCKVVRESYLLPLLAEGQPVAQIEFSASLPLRDLQGQPSTHKDVVRALGVKVAPTVLFFGPGGREAAPRIAGMPLPDFYGAYLQERVEAANRAAA